MKKLLSFLAITAIVLTAVAFKTAPPPSTILLTDEETGLYYLTSQEQYNQAIESEGAMDVLDTNDEEATDLKVVVCPGKGVTCKVRLDLDENTTFTYIESKGKGRKNIEIVRE